MNGREGEQVVLDGPTEVTLVEIRGEAAEDEAGAAEGPVPGSLAGGETLETAARTATARTVTIDRWHCAI
jgi:hypothetical protein